MPLAVGPTRPHCAMPSTETLAHIIQRCHLTHEARAARHDSISKYLISALQKRDYITNEEPAIPTPVGICSLDIVAWNENKCVVVDTTIDADNHDSNDAHDRKCIYYVKPAIRHLSPLPSQLASSTLQIIGQRSTSCKIDLTKLTVDELRTVSLQGRRQGVLKASGVRQTAKKANCTE